MNFKQPYNRENFLAFIKDLIPGFDKDVRPVALNSSFKSIKKVDSLGYSNELDLSIFELRIEGKAEKKIHEAKEGFRLMKEHQSYRALAVYYSEDDQNWRLALMQMTPDRTETGKNTQRFSNPRRYSFLLGPEAKTKTPENFLIKKDKVKDFDDLLSRFSVEVVNKEFYREIAKFFSRLTGGDRKDGSKLKHFESELILPSVSTEDKQTHQEFAVRLIGRIIFCWFLKQKESTDGISLLPDEFLSKNAVLKKEGYYHSILEKVFFEVLNKPVNTRNKEARNGYDIIPYLNGGLFDPHVNDFYDSQPNYGLKIPDQWFVDLFEVLETYNFTIDENTVLDTDLSIDPEMLGRIFENLLAEINPETGESARKSTGSYYTPRPIVEYMVDQSLIQYLITKTGIKKEIIEALISLDETDDIELATDDKLKVVDALDTVKIIDPACGSGAFPIGILQKIIWVLQHVDKDSRLWFEKKIEGLDPLLQGEFKRKFEHENLDYIRKTGVIKDSIYGVDIQPIAVEVSKLRCFLTLIVDEDINDQAENRGIIPLPNLEFKFVAANTLINLPGSLSSNNGQTALFEEKDEIEKLKRVRDKYFISNGSDKERTKLEFYRIQKQMFDNQISNYKGELGEQTMALARWDPFGNKSSDWFDSEWMFGFKNFDIAIANPPYIEFKKLPRSQKDNFEDLFSCAKGKYDIYVLFIEIASKLLNRFGTLCYVCPTTFMKKDFGKSLRLFINQHFSVRSIIDFSDLQIFDSVTNYTGIFIFSRTNSANYHFKYHHFLSSNEIDNNNFQSILLANESDINKQILTLSSTEISADGWAFRDNAQQSILTKSSIGSVRLKDVTECIFQGIASGKDEVFYVNSEAISKNSLEKDALHKLAKGKDVKAYRINWSGNYVIYLYDEYSVALPENEVIDKFPNIYAYLSKNKSALSTRDYFNNSNKKWYELWNQRDCKKFFSERIMVPEISSQNNFAITNDYFGNTKTYNIMVRANSGLNTYYLLGLLNSKLLDFLYKLLATPQAGGFYAYKTQFLDLLPIKVALESEQIVIAELAKKIIGFLAKPEGNDKEGLSKCLSAIDEEIYRLYNITQDEIKTVENS